MDEDYDVIQPQDVIAGYFTLLTCCAGHRSWHGSDRVYLVRPPLSRGQEGPSHG